VIPDRDAPVLVHCRVGARSERAATWLAAAGYTNVVNLRGAIDEWRDAGGDWDEDVPGVTADQARRYARQIALPEVGVEGQRRLLAARVLIVGAGGLGSPVALYLAAAGVGTIGIVDDDFVDATNLHRQVIHTGDRIGESKVESARRALTALNPDIDVRAHRERLGPENADRVVADYDVVVDATDNLAARYAINDAAVRLRTPLVHGSVYRWEGHVTTIVPFAGPCYRCLYPTEPAAELAPDCDVAGVLGVVPGTVGMLQATEALKLLLGAGDALNGRVLVFDALRMTVEVMQVDRDPACEACGTVAAVAAADHATASR
jgi:sulfur-carrier protein adenylyltransferase/sulfurtransferase